MSEFSIPGQPSAYRVRHQSIERNNFIDVTKSVYTDKPLKGIIEIEFNFVMAIPRKMKGRFERGETIAHTAKPDVTELTQFAMKYLEHIAFRSSSQIVRINASKCYGFHPRTDVRISLIPKSSPSLLPFDDLT